MSENVLRNPGRALEIRIKVGTSFASRGPKAVLPSMPEAISFRHTAKRLYLGKNV